MRAQGRKIMTQQHSPATPDNEIGQTGADKNRKLSPAAQRALDEAAQRRKSAETPQATSAEIGGRGGADPARFGDWEINGRAVDF